ncbi:hypothetical protein JWG45_00680 [Leptospira sp. 201903070]|uniref:Uncharacterized protein n=1 Tax=Leptospira ainlahdjerensis TaxID=2810033 RepID=A0ABS2U5K0_9LEPT|nr:hypothetical protein [Leptospira ainlahdjerensis]MBM9575655.1 hypothetical protein [Leptospira ainlahdjerensis]
MNFVRICWVVIFLLFIGTVHADEKKEFELSWKSDPSSESYHVEFSDSSDFKIVLRTLNVKEKRIQFYQEPNERYVRVVGIGRMSSKGEPSDSILIESLRPFVKLERKTPSNPKAIILSPTRNEKLVLDNPSAGRNGVRVFFRVNEGEWKEYQGSISGLQEGKNDVEFYSETASGVKEGTRLMEVVQDTRRPEIRVEIGKGFRLDSIPVTRKDQNLQVEVLDLVSGVAETEFFFLQNGKKIPVNPNSQEKNIYKFQIPQILEDGSFGIQVRAKDFAGNQAEETIFGILDGSPPICRLSPQANFGSLLPVQSEIQIQCEDLISGTSSIQFQQNGNEFRNYAEGLVLTPGKQSFEFRITDKVGNSFNIKAEYTILSPTLKSNVTIQKK